MPWVPDGECILPAIRSAAIPRMDPGFRRDDERGDVVNPCNFNGLWMLFNRTGRSGTLCPTW